MAFTNGVSGQGKWAVLAVAAAAAALLAFSACGGSSSASAGTAAVGVPPPEWAANAGGWPAHNYDLANTRATTQTSTMQQNHRPNTPTAAADAMWDLYLTRDRFDQVVGA